MQSADMFTLIARWLGLVHCKYLALSVVGPTLVFLAIDCKKDGTGSCLQVCGRGPEMEGKGEFEILGVLRGLGSWGGG